LSLKKEDKMAKFKEFFTKCLCKQEGKVSICNVCPKKNTHTDKLCLSEIFCVKKASLLIAIAVISILLISVFAFLNNRYQIVNAQEIAWIKQFGTYADDSAEDVSIDSSNSAYIAGFTLGTLPNQTSAGGRDAYVRKYDSNGDEIWTRQFGTSAEDWPFDISVSSNSVYVAGRTAGAFLGQTNAGGSDAFVRKYDSNGDEIWTRQFGTSEFDNIWGISTDSSGNIYVAGSTLGALPDQTSAGGSDAFVRKYDSNGSAIWTRQFGTSGWDIIDSISTDSYNNVYVTGRTQGALRGQTSAGGMDVYVRKYDSNGNEIWTRQFGTASDDTVRDISIDSSNNIYVAGFTLGTFPNQTSAGGIDAFVRKYDSNGNEIWTRQFGTSAFDYANGISIDSSGNINVVGDTDGVFSDQTSVGERDAYVRKYDSNGNMIWTKQFGSSTFDTTTGISTDSSSNILLDIPVEHGLVRFG
jgi:hypothetical protein